MQELLRALFRAAGVHVKRKSITAFGRHFIASPPGGVMIARGTRQYLGRLGQRHVGAVLLAVVGISLGTAT
jgi:hypothetical protein